MSFAWLRKFRGKLCETSASAPAHNLSTGSHGNNTKQTHEETQVLCLISECFCRDGKNSCEETQGGREMKECEAEKQAQTDTNKGGKRGRKNQMQTDNKKALQIK